MTYSENGFIFIITDLNYFYLIKDKKEISIKEYQINVDELKNNKNQIKEKETKIWCDKYGTHAILKLNNIPYYFNSQKNMQKLMYCKYMMIIILAIRNICNHML